MPSNKSKRVILPRQPYFKDFESEWLYSHSWSRYEDEPYEGVEARAAIFILIDKAPPAVRSDFFQLLRLGKAAVLRAAARLNPPPSASHVKTIWHHGDSAYPVEGGSPDPVAVTGDQHRILQEFAATRIAMGRKELESATDGVSVSRALKELVSRHGGRFRPAVRMPGRKGRGGYFAHVLSFTSSYHWRTHFVSTAYRSDSYPRAVTAKLHLPQPGGTS